MTKKHVLEYELLMEQMGWSYEDLYRAVYVELDYLHSELSKIHNSQSVHDLHSYFLLIVKKMLDVWESIHLILDNKIDLTSLFSLSRVIADNYAIMFLIHINARSENERDFRHYLFILDGITSRIKQLEKAELPYKSHVMPLEEYKRIINKNDSTLRENKKNKEIILNFIRKNPLYEKSLDNTIIKHSNWKYKKIKDKPTKENRYSWEDMYGITFKSEIMTLFFSAYLSLFVHGLGISNYNFDDDNELHRQIILCANISCMNLVKDAVKKLYKADINHYDINFENTPMVEYLIRSTNEDYAEQKINNRS